MENIFTGDTTVIFFELALAALLGMALGIERSVANKRAGLRTYALVSMGSCLFIAIALATTSAVSEIAKSVDPFRIASAVVSGVGFIGAGMIIFRAGDLKGLTTAAGVWVAAGIGMAVGFGMYAVAIFVTLITLAIFTIFWSVETKIKKVTHNDEKEG